MICHALVVFACLLQAPTKQEQHWSESKKLTHFPNEIPKSPPAIRSGSAPDEVAITELHNFACWSFVVESIVDHENMIIRLGDKSYWLAEYPTKGISDDDKVNLIGLVKFVEPKTFTTVLGASRTVKAFKLMNQDDLNKRMNEEMQRALKAKGATFRLKNGKEFFGFVIESKKGIVTFYVENEDRVKYQLSELDQTSQSEVRKQVQRKK